MTTEGLRGRTGTSAPCAGSSRRPGWVSPGSGTAFPLRLVPRMSEAARVLERPLDPPSEPKGGASRIRWHWLYLVANVPLVAAIFALPRDHTYLWGAMGICSTLAIVVGVAKNKPARRAPWILIAIAQFAFITGGIAYDVLTKVLHENNPFPSIANVFYLVAYPVLAIGLFLMVRAQSRERNIGAVLDSLIVTVGLALLSWIYLIEPFVRAAQLTFLTKAVSMAYPLGDVVILYMLARLLLGGARRNTSVTLLSAAGIGFLTADSIYRWSQLQGNPTVGGRTALGVVAFFVLGATAALHPSMREVTEKQPSRPLSPTSLVAISVSTLVAPALLVVRSILNPRVDDGALIGTVSALLFILVMLRITGLAQNRAALAQREHILRDLGERLVGTTELNEVVSVSLSAVAAIVGDSSGACLLTQRGTEGERVVGAIPTILAGSSVVLQQSDQAHGGLKATFPKMPPGLIDERARLDPDCPRRRPRRAPPDSPLPQGGPLVGHPHHPRSHGRACFPGHRAGGALDDPLRAAERREVSLARAKRVGCDSDCAGKRRAQCGNTLRIDRPRLCTSNGQSQEVA